MNKRILRWGAAFAAGLALVDALILEKYFFEVNTYDIGKRHGNKKVKIVLLTDLHFRKRLWPFHTKLAKKVNALQPDLILIAGDLIDEHGTAAPAKKFLSMLPQDVPKAAIMGNHDHKCEVSLRQFYELYRQNNCALLMNESKAFTIDGHRIMVTGLDDFIEGKASFTDAVEGVCKEENHIMLVHAPKQHEKAIEKMRKMNADRREEDRLNIQHIFAGHNHGGQVKILGYAPVMPDKAGSYMSGWYNKKPPYLYVSKGFGTSTLPVRFGARAEVTLFNLSV